MRKTFQVAFFILCITSPFGQQDAWADKFLTNEYSLDFYDAPLFSCDAYGFDILVDASIHFKEMSFFDKQGDLVKFRVKWKLTNVVYKNSLDTTKILVADPGWGANQWINVETGQIVQTGLAARVTVPGLGTLNMGAGRLIINGDGTITYNGQRADTEGNVAQMCDYLGTM